MANGMTDKIAAKYYRYGLWLTIALFVIGMMVDSIMYTSNHWNLIISAVFTFISITICSISWKSVAKSSPTRLTHFYLAASLLRMLTALAIFIIYCFVIRQYEMILHFVAYFLSFYIVTLVYNVLFFARMEKTLKRKV